MNMDSDKIIFIDDIDAKDLINPKNLHLDDKFVVVGCIGAPTPESVLKLGVHHVALHAPEPASNIAHVIVLCGRVIDNIDAETIAEFMRSVEKAQLKSETFTYDIPDSDYVFSDFANTTRRTRLSRMTWPVRLCCGTNRWAQIGMKRALRQIRLLQKKDCAKEI